jgi:GTP-binding protein
LDDGVRVGDMTPLFETIVARGSPPVDLENPFCMQFTTLKYNSYVGQIGIGRIQRRRLLAGSTAGAC